MSASKNAKKATTQSVAAETIREFDNDVLFQKICNKWYAFSVIDGECLMTEVPAEHVNAFSTKAKNR
jgi:hypothetical protein